MLRLLLCVVVFICCTSLGIIKASSIKNRRLELENTLELIRLLELEISYRRETLAKAFERTSRLKSCWISEVFISCAEELKAQKTLSESWYAAMQKHINRCPLGRSETDIIRDISLGLGKSDINGQSKIFAPAIIRLEKCLKDAAEQEIKQGKMYIGLGIAAGIAAAIILI